MDSIELTGKTIEDVREQAAAHFGVPDDQIELTDVEEKSGLLGFLGGGVVATASVKAEDPVEAPAEEEPAVTEAPADADDEDAPEEVDDDALARLANHAEAVANEILQLMGVAVEAHATEISDEEVTIDLSGDDIALVIGKHGDTLDALQLLVAIIANRDAEVNARVVVDAEEYRERRYRSLEATALAHAEKAKQADREIVVRDLKAYERRIIHLALRDDPEVETYSEGEGRHRNLVISPIPQQRAEAADDDADDDL